MSRMRRSVALTVLDATNIARATGEQVLNSVSASDEPNRLRRKHKSHILRSGR